jgi:hypothetical protein
MKMTSWVLVAGLLTLSVFPAEALAQLVPCNGPDCNACHIIQLVQEVIRWLVAILTILGAIGLAVSGLKMAMSGGDSGAVSAAKNQFSNIIIGFIILLGAWLFVDTIMQIFTDQGRIRPWNNIICPAPLPTLSDARPQPLPAGTGGTTGGGGPALGGTGCTNCTTMAGIPTNSNPCRGQCQIRPEMQERLTTVNLGESGMRLSEGFPPTVVHREGCHNRATCVDVSYNTTPTAAQINRDTAEMRQNNLTPVYEVPTAARQAELQAQGVTNVIVVPGINREHYSVYMCDVDSSPRACGR